jgi:hypothetical protein
LRRARFHAARAALRLANALCDARGAHQTSRSYLSRRAKTTARASHVASRQQADAYQQRVR